jgi:hypothetical protein
MQHSSAPPVELLGGLAPYDFVSLTLSDGTVIDGRACPIVYLPERRLHVEVRTRGDPGVRYVVTAEHDGEWGTLGVRRGRFSSDEWTTVGTVESVATLGFESE